MSLFDQLFGKTFLEKATYYNNKNTTQTSNKTPTIKETVVEKKIYQNVVWRDNNGTVLANSTFSSTFVVPSVNAIVKLKFGAAIVTAVFIDYTAGPGEDVIRITVRKI